MSLFSLWALICLHPFATFKSVLRPLAANEFRLLLDGSSEGSDSPAPGGCGPELPLTRNPKKNTRRRAVCLRAPTAELKAVWQNLIQRQM